jgi:hypothetical protein
MFISKKRINYFENILKLKIIKAETVNKFKLFEVLINNKFTFNPYVAQLLLKIIKMGFSNKFLFCLSYDTIPQIITSVPDGSPR